MKPARIIQSTWLTMLALQTIGSIDVKHRLPAPRQYVAISVLWGILSLLADTGFGRVAARLSVLVLLTASVVGPFGARFVSWLSMIARQFAIPPTDASVRPTSTPSAPSQTGPVRA